MIIEEANIIIIFITVGGGYNITTAHLQLDYRSLIRRPHTPVVFVEFYVRPNQPKVVALPIYKVLGIRQTFWFSYCVPLVEHSRSIVDELEVHLLMLKHKIWHINHKVLAFISTMYFWGKNSK